MDQEKLNNLKKELDKQVGDETQQILLDLIEEIKKVNFLTPKEKQQELKDLYDKVSQLTETKTDTLIELIRELSEITRDIKLEIPEKLKVEVEKQPPLDLPQYPTEIKVSNLKDPLPYPTEIALKKPAWLEQITTRDLTSAVDAVTKAVEGTKIDLEKYREPKNALAVRLVDKKGQSFYEALLAVTSGGGGSSFPFENVSGTAKAALVDAQGHVQVDVLTGGGGGTQYIEGNTDATFTGTIALAEGAANTATPLQVDASKHLQVDIAADSVGIGGGTQYTEADTDATITGTAVMWEDASDTLRAVSTTKPLPVSEQGDFMLGTDFSNVFGAASLISATPAVKVEEQGTVTVDATGSGDVPITLDSEVVAISNDDLISTNNSTTSVLGNGAVFTGTGDDLLGYSAVTIQLDSSHDSATDGMTFQFSTDNSNWDDVYTFTYTVADGARRFQFPVTARYFRVVYTNGTTLQTHFRVQTILHRQNQLTTIHRVVDDISPDRSAQLTKAVIIAQKAGSGGFTPIQSTAGGNLKMSVQEISDGLDIGAGNAGSETQRVSISTDDVNLAAIKTAIEGTLTVDGSGVTQPVSGTFWQVTQPISAAALPLPAGAATSAKQLADGHAVTIDNISTNEIFVRGGGTAGSPTDGEVVAIQGIASGTAMAVTESSPISGFATSAKQLADGHNVVVSSGTVTTVSTLSTITGLTMSNAAAQVTGDEAHDAPDAGNPLKTGGKAQTHLAAPEEVADNDRVNALFDRVGRQAVYQGYMLKSADINDSTSGNNTIVAAVATKRIRVLSVLIVSDGTTDVRWESGAGGTALTGQVPLQAREGYSISNSWGLFETAAVNTLLNLELTAAVNVHGFVTYIEVDD